MFKWCHMYMSLKKIAPSFLEIKSIAMLNSFCNKLPHFIRSHHLGVECWNISLSLFLFWTLFLLYGLSPCYNLFTQMPFRAQWVDVIFMGWARKKCRHAFLTVFHYCSIMITIMFITLNNSCFLCGAICASCLSDWHGVSFHNSYYTWTYTSSRYLTELMSPDSAKYAFLFLQQHVDASNHLPLHLWMN